MEDIIERLEVLNYKFEEAISYEDWDAVEDTRKDLLNIIRDLDMDSPISQFDEDF
jgi:hypothetical protein